LPPREKRYIERWWPRREIPTQGPAGAYYFTDLYTLLCQVFQLGQCGQCLQRLAEANAKSTGPYYDSRYNRDNETLPSGFCTDKKKKNQILLIYKEIQKGSVGKSYMTDGRKSNFSHI
jgi:hypothetical protein